MMQMPKCKRQIGQNLKSEKSKTWIPVSDFQEVPADTPAVSRRPGQDPAWRVRTIQPSASFTQNPILERGADRGGEWN